ncbi:helix-turn-helix domain-containing protein [Aquincola sp. MAHUQ-54]|uniref:Helix-turn-helix domain-containing protein n=1 Tax=Aquincola agrisoli TaxID=3119538 RepID=A0AAW9QC33_9BURK
MLARELEQQIAGGVSARRHVRVTSSPRALTARCSPGRKPRNRGRDSQTVEINDLIYAILGSARARKHPDAVEGDQQVLADLRAALAFDPCAAPSTDELERRRLVMHQRRAGGQSQHSEILRLAPRSDRIQQALEHARRRLARPLRVDELAEVARLSPRQFSRVFTAETGQSPAKAVQGLRLEAARLVIEQSRHPLEVVARETGCRDRRHLREAFLRGFGVPPQAVRREARASQAPGQSLAESMHRSPRLAADDIDLPVTPS